MAALVLAAVGTSGCESDVAQKKPRAATAARTTTSFPAASRQLACLGDEKGVNNYGDYGELPPGAKSAAAAAREALESSFHDVSASRLHPGRADDVRMAFFYSDNGRTVLVIRVLRLPNGNWYSREWSACEFFVLEHGRG